MAFALRDVSTVSCADTLAAVARQFDEYRPSRIAFGFGCTPRGAAAIQRLAFLPRPAYVPRVKPILLCLAIIVGSLLTGCTSGKGKSRYRNYEGDSSPGIRMLEEKPGYPLNTR